MVKIDVAKSVNFNELIYSKEAEVVSMRILNQPNSYVSLFSLAKNEEITAEAMLGNRYYYCFNGNGEIFIENSKKSISNGDFLEILSNHSYSIEASDNLKLIEIGEKMGDDGMENQTLKMLESAAAFNLAEIVDYQEGKIISKNLVAKNNLVITVMSVRRLQMVVWRMLSKWMQPLIMGLMKFVIFVINQLMLQVLPTIRFISSTRFICFQQEPLMLF